MTNAIQDKVNLQPLGVEAQLPCKLLKLGGEELEKKRKAYEGK